MATEPVSSNDTTQAVRHRVASNKEPRFSNRVVVTSQQETMSSRKVKICTCAVIVAVIGLAVCLTIVFVLGRGDSAGTSCLDLSPSKICSRDNPYPFYGTKTDYILAKNNFKGHVISPDKHSCTAKQLYLFSRHAARFPDYNKIETMSKKLPDLINKILKANTHDAICEKFQEDLGRWNITMKPSDDNSISPTGKMQSTQLGERMKKEFPSLLGGEYSKDNFEFGFTSRDRTKETAQAFAQGLFNKDIPELNKLPAQDNILQFHKTCEDILKKKGWKKEKPVEEVKFREGDIMKTVLNDMSQRLGIPLDFDTFKLMLSICQFEYSMKQDSVWCPLFKTDYLKVMEYLDDLDDYYQDAYGLDRNYQQACPMVQHLIDRFGSTVNSSGKFPKAILMFSHAGAIKKVISHFGLFQDAQLLTAQGFCTSQDRKWRSSLICPFNSNIAFVLYECSGKHYIEAYLQEKPVLLKGCTSSLCPWDTFLKTYNTDCDLNRICSI